MESGSLEQSAPGPRFDQCASASVRAATGTTSAWTSASMPKRSSDTIVDRPSLAGPNAFMPYSGGVEYFSVELATPSNASGFCLSYDCPWNHNRPKPKGANSETAEYGGLRSVVKNHCKCVVVSLQFSVVIDDIVSMMNNKANKT